MPDRDDLLVGVLGITAFEKRAIAQLALRCLLERNHTLPPRLIEDKALDDHVLSGNVDT